MRLGELFAGYGGLGMGVEQVFDVERAWVSEFDPAPSKILAHHWPDVPNLGDITKIDWSTVEPVDILTGGSPCQDISVAGARAGMTHGTRSNLWVEMREAIATLRPRLVVWENVSGALSSTARSEADSEMESGAGLLGDGSSGPLLRAAGRVFGDLASIGYDASGCVVRASDVGACHRRARVFVLAWPADSDGDVFREYRGEPSEEETRARESHGSSDSGGRAELRLMPTPEAALAVRGGASDPAKRKAGGHSVSLADAVHLLPTPSVADVQGGRKHRSGERRGELLLNGIAAADLFQEYAPAIVRHERVFGDPEPAATESGPKGGRRLASPFVEWMMALPPGHVTAPEIWGGVKPSAARNAQLTMLGNGVVPAQAAAAIRGLLERAA